MKEKPELTFRNGKRVRLRLLDESDVPQLTAWMNDENVTKFLSRSTPMTPAQEQEWFEGLGKRQNDYVFGVELIDDDVLIGTMGLHGIDHINGTATSGSYIGDEPYRSNGYGTEAKMLLLKFAFHSLNLRKICSSALSYNGSSIRYQEKCGAITEGVRKDQLFKDGQYWDEVLMATWRKDWEPLWEKYAERFLK